MELKKEHIIIIFLILALIYLRIIGILGDLETVILSLLSMFILYFLPDILPLIITYILQPKVALKIENVRFDEARVNHNLGYYLTATLLNKGKKIALRIEAHFDIKDGSGKTPSLLFVETETINKQRRVKVTEETFKEDIGYAWVLKGGKYYQGFLKELRHNDKVDLRFPYNTFCFGVGRKDSFKLFASEYLLKLEHGKKYEVKITVKGEDSEKNTVESTKKVKIKI